MKTPLKALCALHLGGNGLLLWLGYVWLSVPESNAVHLLWSALIVIFLLVAGLWMHGTAFAYFNADPRPSFRSAAAQSLRHLPALFLLALAGLIIYSLVAFANGRLAEPAFRTASWLTMTIRKPVPPPGVLAFFHAIVWLFRWLILPALLLPVAATVASNGFKGFRRIVRKLPLLRSLATVAALLGALWGPTLLLRWIPKAPNFQAEFASFLIRAGLAYLLFSGLLLVTERVTCSGIPSLTQRSSSPTP